ncbi:hypothetical protein T01_308 [Trichinella spiralis]|uniref:Uncharacterized protein n=1 Tax=Trichinella spiralis TaxID=6334 RepID=A0A0V1BPA7_TRISP|nr:hypothetical protein T01_308 [Trichinella spiralis]
MSENVFIFLSLERGFLPRHRRHGDCIVGVSNNATKNSSTISSVHRFFLCLLVNNFPMLNVQANLNPQYKKHLDTSEDKSEVQSHCKLTVESLYKGFRTFDLCSAVNACIALSPPALSKEKQTPLP